MSERRILTDLESLVTLLEVAALALTESRSSTFTREQLYAEARWFAGNEHILRDRELDGLLASRSIVKPAGGAKYRLAA